jgi:DNA-binding response OmpR family regulator
VSKQSLLLVDGDTRSLRVLEVSLRKAGFMVTAALSVQDALDKLGLHAPDLIISETTFPDGDGFELRRRVRATPDWSEIPFIFLTAEAAIENKIRGLELGVDDYLTKPIYIKEIVTRINILLQKRQRVRFEERRDGRTRFAGRVHDMPVVDVIQTIEISRKSGVIQFVGERGRQAAIYFRDGRVIDAEAGSLQGEDAVYRLLTWSDGEFEVVFRTVRRREVITMSSQGLLMEGMRRLDEWSRLFEQLPPLTHRFEVDTTELAARLGDVPDDNNRILRLFDSKRTLLEVIDGSDVGDLECLQAISRLYFEDLLIDLDHTKLPRRDTGKPLPAAELDTPSPGEAVASAPHAIAPGPRSELDSFEDDLAAARSEAPAAAALVTAEPAEAGEPTPDAGPVARPDAEQDFHGIGPLMGGYRPSSLRLIDEAVAAAQAIEPGLVADEDLAIAAAGPAVDAAAVPAAPGYGAAPASPEAGTLSASYDAAPASSLYAVKLLASREESGLRMIGSLGRDRAEASGELPAMGRARPLRSETARELVTILPRRVTRELPAISAPLSESLPTPTPTSPVLATKATPTAAVEVASAVGPLPRLSRTGSGVRAQSRSSRVLRLGRSLDAPGPGLGAVLLVILAAVLAGTAVLLRLRRHSAADEDVKSVREPAPALTSRGSSAAPAAPEIAASAARPLVAPQVPGNLAGAHDAGPQGPPDAGPPDAGPPDAGPPGPPDAGPPPRGMRRAVVGPHGSALALYDQGREALAESEVARALELADASLKLRRTASTLLLRAQALQRLDRIDDALAAVDAATAIAPGLGTVWEVRGRILWSARRRDEARVAFAKFLELAPNSPKAPSVRRLMNEPR